MQRIRLAPDYEISRVIRGGWQMAGGHGARRLRRGGRGHGRLRRRRHHHLRLRRHLHRRRGADRRLPRRATARCAGAAALARIKVHTKCVPDLDLLPRLARADVAAIDRPLAAAARRRAARPRPVPLVGLRRPRLARGGAAGSTSCAREGKIDRLGGTNFDTEHMAAIADAGVPLVSMQVQYSLLDRRPEQALRAAAAARGVSLLCYGTVAGGFLGDRWLGAARAGASRSRTARSPSTSSSSTTSAAGTSSRRCSRRCAGSPTGTAPTSPRSRAPRSSPGLGSRR